MTDRLTIDPSGPVDILVKPPGSKSITNRALVIAALADGESVLEGMLESDDTAAMRNALDALGIAISDRGGAVVVSGGRLGGSEQVLDVNLSGTSFRFLVALAALANGTNIIDGRPRIRERPIAQLAEALRTLGVGVQLDPVTGGAPVSVRGGTLGGGIVTMDAFTSSQPVSGLMMVAPYAASPITIRFQNGALISRSYVETTGEVMAAFGVEPLIDRTEIRIPLGSYQPRVFSVESDASAAVYPWCAAAITGGVAEAEGLGAASTQSDLGVLNALEAMGCTVERGAGSIRVSGPQQLSGISMNLEDCPDGAMAVAVCAAFASSPSELTGLSSWAVKETDRLVAVSTELTRLGVDVDVSTDRLIIRPPTSYRAAAIDTYDDHRMAMSFALAGLRIAGVEIRDPGVVSKTWPSFWKEFATWT